MSEDEGIKLKFKPVPPLVTDIEGKETRLDRPISPPDEYDPEDRYHQGYHIEGDCFADRSIEEIRDGIQDIGGKERGRIEPKSQSFISSNMLEGHGRGFRLRKRFRDFFKLSKGDIQDRIERIKKEIAEMEDESK